MSKIIIHADGVPDLDSINLVASVIESGKISADGKSYCYGFVGKRYKVFTDKPRKGTDTYVFYVMPKKI